MKLISQFLQYGGPDTSPSTLPPSLLLNPLADATRSGDSAMLVEFGTRKNGNAPFVGTGVASVSTLDSGLEEDLRGGDKSFWSESTIGVMSASLLFEDK